MFNKQAILQNMESLRLPNGAFIASPEHINCPYDPTGKDYVAVWLRDFLYCVLAYYYLGEYEKLKEGIHVAFNIFKKYKKRLKLGIASPTAFPEGTPHIKYGPDLDEAHPEWMHNQLDVFGLFLHMVADLNFKNIHVFRNEEDYEIIQLIIYYLRSVEYWQRPDFGMWEECKIRHASSIGAVTEGLAYLKRRDLGGIKIPDSLIQPGRDAVKKEILPFESRDNCGKPQHRHDCDAAQLTLLWPYNFISDPEEQKKLLSRIIDGHKTENEEGHKLLQTHGLNRYWGDDYFRSRDKGKYQGISAEWPMFFFWISIIYSQWHEEQKAVEWFKRGSEQVVADKIPEAYYNGKPNPHTPLAWAHAIALIAFSKLSPKLQKELSEH